MAILQNPKPGPEGAFLTSHLRYTCRHTLIRIALEPSSAETDTRHDQNRATELQRHHSRGRIGHAPLSRYPRTSEEPAAGVRQTDGVLPALNANAGRYPRNFADLDARGSAPLSALTRGWIPLRRTVPLRGATEAGRHRPGISDRQRVYRLQRLRARARRQHFLRTRPRQRITRGDAPA